MVDRPYHTLEGFAELFLEDSFVLAIRDSGGRLELDAEIVLRAGHPRYQAPLPGEAYCYRRGTIAFKRVTAMRWLRRATVISTDNTGSSDLGNIDSFVVRGPSRFELEGDWGHCVVEGDAPVVEWC